MLVHLLGSKPEQIEPMDGGLMNYVFEARHPEGDMVVRLSANPGQIEEDIKEQWAMARAREQGVPVLQVGTEPIPFPYMVSRKVAGVEGIHHLQRLRISRELGRFARMIHAVPTSGFGHTFEWSENRLSRKETWSDYLEREFHGEQRLSMLEEHDMLRKHALKALRRTLRNIEDWKLTSRLNDGDLRLKNVIVGPDRGIIAILDWEFCTSNVAPY